jgi:hypothetical protein
MGRPYGSRDKLLDLISDGKPRSSRDVADQLHFTDRAAESVCYRCWKAGLLLRAAKPIRERNRKFAGRAGSRYNTRSYYLFVLNSGSEETEAENLRFLSFTKTPRIVKPNKSQLILRFLRDNVDRAFYTSEIAKQLKGQGITIRDVAANLRRYERKGQAFFRGYRSAEHETPFAAGYIVTYLDASKSRSQAIAEAIQRTDSLLEGGSHVNPLAERIRRLDEIIERGVVGSKPEAIRQALTEYFNKLDEQQLRRARLRLLEKEST